MQNKRLVYITTSIRLWEKNMFATYHPTMRSTYAQVYCVWYSSPDSSTHFSRPSAASHNEKKLPYDTGTIPWIYS